MLGSVPTTPKSLEDYRPVIGDERTEELKALAEPLKDARVLHVNATAFGGGVAEILATMVPLLNDAGLRALVRMPARCITSCTHASFSAAVLPGCVRIRKRAPVCETIWFGPISCWPFERPTAAMPAKFALQPWLS